MGTEFVSEYNNCPICNREMTEIVNNETMYEVCCPNKCFYFLDDFGLYEVFIYNEYLEFAPLSKKEYQDIQEKINKSISYWKYNDRYLMKILGAS